MLKSNKQINGGNCTATACKLVTQDFPFPLVTLTGAGNVCYMCAVTLLHVAAVAGIPGYWKIRVLNSNKDGWERQIADATEARECWYELLELPVLSATLLKSHGFTPT